MLSAEAGKGVAPPRSGGGAAVFRPSSTLVEKPAIPRPAGFCRRSACANDHDSTPTFLC